MYIILESNRIYVAAGDYSFHNLEPHQHGFNSKIMNINYRRITMVRLYLIIHSLYYIYIYYFNKYIINNLFISYNYEY